MNIHEYQAKELLEKFGVATTRGKVAASPEEAERIARELAPAEVVVKAQIHAGGRGKGGGISGVISGRAIYDGRLDLRAALALLREEV